MSQDLVPHALRQGYTPELGGRLIVDLDSELVDTIVVKIVSENMVLAIVMSKPHGKWSRFKYREQIGARRSISPLGQEVWLGVRNDSLPAEPEASKPQGDASGEIG